MRSGYDNGAAPDVSVIVVSYNSEPYLERSLGTVASSGHELLVVDNASTDGSVALVRSRFPAARLVELDRNVGFGAACNEGMRHAAGSYFLLLNPDAWPVGEGIDTLVRFAKEPAAPRRHWSSPAFSGRTAAAVRIRVSHAALAGLAGRDLAPETAAS